MNENAENTCATAASREAMEKVCRFLKETGTYYLATADGEQPRVRPFGTIHIFDGKLYIQTGRAKDVSKQLAANPKFELCAFKAETGEWLRLSGNLLKITGLKHAGQCWMLIRRFVQCTMKTTETHRLFTSKMQRQCSARSQMNRWKSNSDLKHIAMKLFHKAENC